MSFPYLIIFGGSPDGKHQCHLGAYWKCRFWSFIPDVRARNLHLSRSPNESEVTSNHIWRNTGLQHKAKPPNMIHKTSFTYNLWVVSLLPCSPAFQPHWCWFCYCSLKNTLPLSLLPALAVYAVPSAGNVFAPFFDLTNFLLPSHPSRCSSVNTSTLKLFLVCSHKRWYLMWFLFCFVDSFNIASIILLSTMLCYLNFSLTDWWVYHSLFWAFIPMAGTW